MYLECGGCEAGGKDLLQGLLKLGAPVQFTVGLPGIQGRCEGVFRRIILKSFTRQQYILQPLSQNKSPAFVSLLHPGRNIAFAYNAILM